MTHEFYRVQNNSQQETKLRFQTFAHHCLSEQIVHVLNFPTFFAEILLDITIEN